MRYLTFSKLKAYKKAENLTKKIKELSKNIPRGVQYDLRMRIRNNSIQTLESIKTVWVKGRKIKEFINHMDEVILNNSELESLLFEAKTNGFVDIETYEELKNECVELRELQLHVINNAAVYFENGKAPDSWFDL